MLTVDTSDLDFVLVGDLVEGFFVSHQLWKLDVDGGSHGGTKIGWARGDVTEMVIMRKLANGFNVLGGSAESFENSSNVRSRLHGDDSQLILLINPNKESLGVIVENTSSRWPVSVETARFKESISLPIKV